MLIINAPNTANPISFTGLSFNVPFTYYSLQNDVQYSTYPFATESRPNNTRLLAYRFRAYESVYNASYRDWETDRKSTRLNSSHRSLSRMPSSA